MAIKILEANPIDMGGTVYLRLPKAWLDDLKINKESVLEILRTNRDKLIIQIKDTEIKIAGKLKEK